MSAQWPASVRAILGSDTLSNVHGSLHRSKKKVIHANKGQGGKTAIQLSEPVGGWGGRFKKGFK